MKKVQVKKYMRSYLKVMMTEILKQKVDEYSFHNKVSKGEMARQGLELFMKLHMGEKK